MFLMVCLAVGGFFVSKFDRSRDMSRLVQKESSVNLADPFELSNDRFEGVVSMPVRRSYVDGVYLADGSRRMSMTLPQGEEVFSVFDGSVLRAYVEEDAVDILIKSVDGVLASYIMVGEVLVEEGQTVGEGDLIAKLKEGEGMSCVGGNNFSFSISNERGDVIFDKSIFK